MSDAPVSSDGADPGASLDRLYAAPLAEFIALRNRLAADLKATGDAASSAAMRGRAKPNLAAWTVNRLFLQESEAFDGLVEAGERLRQAQQSGELAALSEAGELRRARIASLLALAGEHLLEEGYATGASTLAKVERTLETIAVYGRSGLLETPPGRLERELEPPGFEVLATLKSLPAVAPGSRAKMAQREEAQKGTSPTKEMQTKAEPRAEPRAASTKDGNQVSAAGPRRIEARPPGPSAVDLAEHRRAVKRGEAALEKARARSVTVREVWRTRRDEATRLEDAAESARRRAEEARRQADRVRARVRRDEAALERAEARESEACDRLEQARAELEKLISGGS